MTGVGGRVDAAILRNRLEANRFALIEQRDHEWDPLVANPGTAIYALLARDFAPLGDRLRSAAGRLRAVPASLEIARRTLHGMPRVHVETAIGQFHGTCALLSTELDGALARSRRCAARSSRHGWPRSRHWTSTSAGCAHISTTPTATRG